MSPKNGFGVSGLVGSYRFPVFLHQAGLPLSVTSCSSLNDLGGGVSVGSTRLVAVAGALVAAAVSVGFGVAVAVGLSVGVAVAVSVGFEVSVGVGVEVAVAVGVRVNVGVALAVGTGVFEGNSAATVDVGAGPHAVLSNRPRLSTTMMANSKSPLIFGFPPPRQPLCNS